MRDANDIYKEAVLEVGKKTFGPSKKDDDGNEKFLLAVLLFCGSEGMKIILRRGFGRNGLNLGMIIGCFISLIGLAIYSFYVYSNQEKIFENDDSEVSYLVTGLLFTGIGLFILIRGLLLIMASLKAGNLSDYPGEAFVLKFLQKDKWDDAQIKFLAEPLLMICLGVCYAFFNLFGGITLIVMAASVWGRVIIEIIILDNPILQKMKSTSVSISNSKSNNRVK